MQVSRAEEDVGELNERGDQNHRHDEVQILQIERHQTRGLGRADEWSSADNVSTATFENPSSFRFSTRPPLPKNGHPPKNCAKANC